jgi:hypothetical protein
MPMRPLSFTPSYKKPPQPPFSKGGNKDDRFKSPFEKGGFRGICQGCFTVNLHGRFSATSENETCM